MAAEEGLKLVNELLRFDKLALVTAYIETGSHIRQYIIGWLEEAKRVEQRRKAIEELGNRIHQFKSGD